MYSKTILENNVRVITDSMPNVRSLSMGVMLDVGPANERPHQYGLSHLVEHLMFQGTSNRGAMDIARLMDTAGSSIGAFTSRDYTCYTATVLDDYRTYILELLGDILLNSIFPPDNIESEKEAVLREIGMSMDTPYVRADSLLKEKSWPNHHLGRPIAGYPDSVKKYSREDVIYFTHEHYLPDRMIIAAAGNVNHDDFVAQVRDSFWRLAGESKPAPQTVPQFSPGVSIEHVAVSQAYFSIGIKALPYNHNDRYTMHVVNNILGSGISSRLFRSLREQRGLVYNIDSEYHAYRDAGILVIEGSTSPEALLSVLGLILVELWKLFTGDEPVEDEELMKARMQIRGQHLIASEDSNTRMSRLATQELYFGQYIDADAILEKIDGVNQKMIQQLANKYLLKALQNISIAVVGPETPEHYSVAAIESLVAEFNE